MNRVLESHGTRANRLSSRPRPRNQSPTTLRHRPKFSTGDVPAFAADAPPLDLTARFRPVGTTDSEAFFCVSRPGTDLESYVRRILRLGETSLGLYVTIDSLENATRARSRGSFTQHSPQCPNPRGWKLSRTSTVCWTQAFFCALLSSLVEYTIRVFRVALVLSASFSTHAHTRTFACARPNKSPRGVCFRRRFPGSESPSPALLYEAVSEFSLRHVGPSAICNFLLAAGQDVTQLPRLSLSLSLSLSGNLARLQFIF